MKSVFELTPVKLTLMITLTILVFYHAFGENFKFFHILELKALDLRFNISSVRSPSDAAPGVSNIFEDDFLRRNASVKFLDLIYILIAGVLGGFAVSRFSALKGAVLVLIGLLISNYLIFFYLKLWVNIIYPVATLFMVSSGLTAFKLFTEEKDKLFLKSAFGSYLSPVLIEEMIRNKIMPVLDGETRSITAYFTDIEDFSTFSEKLTAEQTVELLNEYFSAMTDILIQEKGTLDKYEGDAIVAFFGAPAHVSDHALRACYTALAMQKKLLELCRKWETEKGDPSRNSKNVHPDEWHPGAKWLRIISRMKMRIGINTGEIIVGDVGSASRMNYTMMGDAVNFAARLENTCKQYGVYTLISENTLNHEFIDKNGEKKRVSDRVEARYIDNIIVKGKSEPIRIYELCAMKGTLTDSEKLLFKAFDEGIQFYFKMQWDNAIERFTEAQKFERFSNNITPSQVYMQRCQIYRENPFIVADENWKGIFRLTQK